MRYAQIRSLDLSNGEGIGVALFVQGCNFHCENCFNSETWDFNGGKEWTPEVREEFLELADRSYIKRISILGGEPLADENLDDVLDLVNRIRLSCPHKNIWLYTGYTMEELDMFNPILDFVSGKCNLQDRTGKVYENYVRQQIVSQCNVLVDGKYIDFQRDITLAYRGSKNQRLIDIQKSLQKGEVVLWQI